MSTGGKIPPWVLKEIHFEIYTPYEQVSLLKMSYLEILEGVREREHASEKNEKGGIAVVLTWSNSVGDLFVGPK